jgi:hypothetical protein
MPPVAKKKPKPSGKPKKKVEKSAPAETATERLSYDKSEVSSGEIVGLFADELQEVYALFGQELDRVNAEDKAVMLVREMRYGDDGIKIKDHEYEVKLCKRHRED